jgi:hypothetical protein
MINKTKAKTTTTPTPTAKEIEKLYKDFHVVLNIGGFYDNSKFNILKELITKTPYYYPNDITKRLNELMEKNADFILITYSIHEFDRNKDLYQIFSRVVSFDSKKSELTIDNNTDRILNDNVIRNITNTSTTEYNIKNDDINKIIEMSKNIKNTTTTTNEQNRNKITDFNIDTNYIPKLSDFLPKDLMNFHSVPNMCHVYKSDEYYKLKKLISNTPNRYSKHYINRINELIEKKVISIMIGYSIYDDKNKDICHIESSEISYDDDDDNDKNNKIVKKTMEHFVTNHITNITIIVSFSDDEGIRIIVKDINGDSLDMEQFKNSNNYNKNQDITKAVKFIKLIKEDEYRSNFNQKMTKITENINYQNKRNENNNKTIIKESSKIKKETQCNKSKRIKSNENKKYKDSSNKRKRTKDDTNQNKKRCKI